MRKPPFRPDHRTGRPAPPPATDSVNTTSDTGRLGEGQTIHTERWILRGGIRDGRRSRRRRLQSRTGDPAGRYRDRWTRSIADDRLFDVVQSRGGTSRSTISDTNTAAWQQRQRGPAHPGPPPMGRDEGADLGDLRHPRGGDQAAAGEPGRPRRRRARLWDGVRIRVARPLGRPARGDRPDPGQLSIARDCQADFGVGFPLVRAAAEQVPFRDGSFDLAISEYGAAIWADLYRWIPEGRPSAAPGRRARLCGQQHTVDALPLRPRRRCRPTGSCVPSSACIASSGPMTRLSSSTSATVTGSGCCAPTGSRSKISSSSGRPRGPQLRLVGYRRLGRTVAVRRSLAGEAPMTTTPRRLNRSLAAICTNRCLGRTAATPRPGRWSRAAEDRAARCVERGDRRV